MKKQFYYEYEYSNLQFGVDNHRFYLLPTFVVAVPDYEYVIAFYFLSFYFEFFQMTNKGKKAFEQHKQ